jgi:hypothetical protein
MEKLNDEPETEQSEEIFPENSHLNSRSPGSPLRGTSIFRVYKPGYDGHLSREKNREKRFDECPDQLIS